MKPREVAPRAPEDKRLPEVAAMAKLCSAAYHRDRPTMEAAVRAAGAELVEFVTNGDDHEQDQGDCQAMIAKWHGKHVVVFRGTETVLLPGLRQLAEDLDVTVTKLGGGKAVASGFWQGMANLMPSILRTLPRDHKLILTGHSKGGSHAHLARIFFHVDEPVEVISFGAPRAANDAFWKAAYGEREALRVVAGGDLAPSWGPRFTHPSSTMLWLKDDGEAKHVVERDEPDRSYISDHRIDGSYIPRLEALVTGAPRPRATARQRRIWVHETLGQHPTTLPWK